MAQQFKLLLVTRSSHMGDVPLLICPENAPGKTEDDGSKLVCTWHPAANAGCFQLPASTWPNLSCYRYFGGINQNRRGAFHLSL